MSSDSQPASHGRGRSSQRKRGGGKGAGGKRAAKKPPVTAAPQPGDGAEGAGKKSAGAAPKRAKPRSRPRELSAGGVVVRGGQVLVIVPTPLAGAGSRVLALPKGHLDPGESALQAATREVREETGIVVVAEPLCEL